ncbi:MAG: arginine--tRNA ligase [Eubacteriaceae bacterium]|nr:arginine--tRNA ligase [Eubacteriaceae bacterium]
MDGRLRIERWLESLVREAIKAIEIDSEASSADIEISVPKSPEQGDFSTNIALKAAKAAKKLPTALASEIAGAIKAAGTPITKIEVANPGFINFFLAPAVYQDELLQILKNGEEYGSIELNAPRSIIVEYVSANPTGPVHIGNARGGAVGDSIANIFAKAGWTVLKEFYVNNAGNQIAKFGQSLSARYMQLSDASYPFPEDGYMGDDIKELARQYAAGSDNGLESKSDGEREAILSEYALSHNIAKMKADLLRYGIGYDNWFFESTLYESANGEVLELLRGNGAVYEKDGAVWFEATKFGCEKDEVLLRSNGLPTYMLSDIAYHYDKLHKRGFDIAANVWGADHHGHVARMKAAMQALGIDPNRLVIILIQLVHLVEGGETVRMSKRKGQIAELSDLIDEVGSDAARFIFNLNNASTHIDFDLSLAVEQSNENPVFYVQYAHARIMSILKNINAEDGAIDQSLLAEPSEMALLKKLCEFSKEIYQAAIEFDPSRITRYAYSLATLFHSFYNAVRVNNDDMALRAARLSLVKAVGIVLRSSLSLIGVSAPESM